MIIIAVSISTISRAIHVHDNTQQSDSQILYLRSMNVHDHEQIYTN